MEGWIKTHRKMLKWEWFTKPETAHLFHYLLLAANFEPRRWQGIDILPGQLVTSINNLSKSTGISVQGVRTALGRLKSTQEVTYETNTKYTLITVINWEQYQDSNTESNKRVTNEQQTNNKLTTTTKESKKERKKEDTPLPPQGDDAENRFADFWEVYPRRRDKGDAEKAYAKALQFTDAETIIAAAQRYAQLCAEDTRPEAERFIKYPATWLNKRSWEDDLFAPEPDPSTLTEKERTALFLRKAGLK